MKPEILIFEEHSSVLPFWWQQQVQGRTLVYFDAHLDLQLINPQRLAALQQCTSLEAVKKLEKPHHLLPDRNFSYSLEDFLYGAYRLGMIHHLIWVTPPHVNTHYAEAVNYLQEMDGVSFEEMMGFQHHPSGWLEGRLLGLPLSICDHTHLPHFSLPVDTLIDIDTDYFVALPSDRAWINPRVIFTILNQLPIEPQWISLARSVSSGFMPLRYRFFADYLAALWRNQLPLAAHYERLFEYDRQLQDDPKNAPGVTLNCHQELEQYPRCSATYYLLSLSQTDGNLAKQYRDQATALDSHYQPDLLQIACEFPNRQLTVYPATVNALEKRLHLLPEGSLGKALTQAALGLIYCAAQQVDRAFQHYQNCIKALGYHPELALEIAKLLLNSNQPDQAISFLNVACLDDKTRSMAHTLLGQIYHHQGLFHEALQHLQTAHNLTPAWNEILHLLLETHHKLGNHIQAQTLWQYYQNRQQQLNLMVP